MLLRIQKLLAGDQLERVQELLAQASFEGGQRTAGRQARAGKRNLQIDRTRSREVVELDRIIVEAIGTNPQIRAFALPRKILPPLYSRYLPGMEYGPHSDNPVIAGKEPVRTDLSITIFLSDPETYEGGELAIASDVGEVKIKLPSGDAVIYPTGTQHSVMPLVKGERAAAVTWIQSMVADPFRRQMLFDLDRLRRLINDRPTVAEESRLANQIYGNLVRLWADV